MPAVTMIIMMSIMTIVTEALGRCRRESSFWILFILLLIVILSYLIAIRVVSAFAVVTLLRIPNTLIILVVGAEVSLCQRLLPQRQLVRMGMGIGMAMCMGMAMGVAVHVHGHGTLCCAGHATVMQRCIPDARHVARPHG